MLPHGWEAWNPALPGSESRAGTSIGRPPEAPPERRRRWRPDAGMSSSTPGAGRSAPRLGTDRNRHGLSRAGPADQSLVEPLVAPVLQMAERRKFVPRLPILFSQTVRHLAHASAPSQDERRPRLRSLPFKGGRAR